MRDKTIQTIKKVHDILVNKNYVTSEELARECKLSRWSIYMTIRKLRLEGVGIIPTKKGYILSESATKNDDVGFIRKCYGRRTSDIIALKACEPDIVKRWQGVEDKTNINNVLKYLSIHPSNSSAAQGGLKYLLSSVNEKGN